MSEADDYPYKCLRCGRVVNAENPLLDPAFGYFGCRTCSRNFDFDDGGILHRFLGRNPRIEEGRETFAALVPDRYKAK